MSAELNRHHCNGLRNQKGQRRVLASDLNLGESELTVLQTLRFYCLGFVGGGETEFMKAEENCRDKFGDRFGNTIAMHTLATLNEICRVRQTSFNFSSPTCACCRKSLSHCEVRLMSSVKALVSEKPKDLELQIMLLCEGGDIFGTHAALRRLTKALSAFEEQTNG